MPLTNVGDAMHEFKKGDLHSGKGGPVVKSRKQAIAIGLSSERRAKGKRSASKRAPVQARAMSGGRY